MHQRPQRRQEDRAVAEKVRNALYISIHMIRQQHDK